VLDAQKLVFADLVLARRLAGANERLRPDEAADMVGAERRF